MIVCMYVYVSINLCVYLHIIQVPEVIWRKQSGDRGPPASGFYAEPFDYGLPYAWASSPGAPGGQSHYVEACVACVAGTYKGANGTAPCSMCSAGTYSPETGQTSASTCRVCPMHSSSGPGSGDVSNCTCFKGYTGANGAQCSACTAGHFKDTNGSTPCTQCAAGTFVTAVAATACLVCPEFSHSSMASEVITDCKCNAGYTGPDGGPCEACVWGTYKEVSGTAECSLCSAGKYLPASGQTSGSACRACPIHSYSVPGSPDPSMIGQDRVSQNVCFACVDARPQQIGDS